MKGAIASIFINLILSIILIVQAEGAPGFQIIIGAILFLFILISVVGTTAYKLKQKRIFGILAIIGFAVFIPAGFIGALSIRKVMDDDLQKKYTNKELKDERV